MTLLDRLRGLFGQPTIDQLAGQMPPQEFLRDCADMDENGRVTDYQLYRRYYNGEQPTQLTSRQRKYLDTSGVGYVENYIETIVDAHASRQTVTGFAVADHERVAEWFDDVWTRAAISDDEPVQDVVHHEVYVYGDAFVQVDPNLDTGRPDLIRQDPSRYKPILDGDGELLAMARVWMTSRRSPSNPDGRQVRRLNLHYPDRIEKYFAVGSEQAAQWAPWLDDDDVEFVPVLDEDGQEQVDPETGETLLEQDPETGEPLQRPVWPTPWTMDDTPDGEPIGINLVQFKRKAMGGPFGRSKVRGIIPQQDALMKQLIDLANVGDHAFPVVWVSGASETTRLVLNPGEILSVPEDAQVGHVQGSDPKPMRETAENTIQRMAARSETPAHLIAGSTLGAGVAGETVKSTFAPMTAALEAEQGPLGNQWAQVMRLAHRVAVAYGLGDPPNMGEEPLITTIFESVEPRNDESEAMVAESHHRLGASKRTLLRKLGYDPDEELDQSREEAEASLAAQEAAFNAGRLPGGAGGRANGSEDEEDR